MRKRYGVMGAVVLLLIFGGLFYQRLKGEETEHKKSIRIGVTLYRGDDSFINTIRSNMEEQAKEYLCYYFIP